MIAITIVSTGPALRLHVDCWEMELLSFPHHFLSIFVLYQVLLFQLSRNRVQAYCKRKEWAFGQLKIMLFKKRSETFWEKTEV